MVQSSIITLKQVRIVGYSQYDQSKKQAHNYRESNIAQLPSRASNTAKVIEDICRASSVDRWINMRCLVVDDLVLVRHGSPSGVGAPRRIKSSKRYRRSDQRPALLGKRSPDSSANQPLRPDGPPWTDSVYC
jgi:hypothetical protein